MNMHKLAGVCALALAANGCSSLTIVGVSDTESAKPLSSAAPRTATQVAAISGELLAPADQMLGDIDGDGYDDFVLAGSQVDRFGEADRDGTATAYLFYGRPAFAAQLVSSDADATFETGLASTRFALGDINGDGLADFALRDRDGFELVFGNKQRLTGHHAKFSTGSVVTYPATIRDGGYAASFVLSLGGLGDLNGDGKDEFAVQIIEPSAQGNGDDYGATDYIIAGRADGWPTGQWDPSIAVAQLGSEEDPRLGKQRIHHFGDLDGDGFNDLLTYGNDILRLYYGKPDGLSGTVSPNQADAELDLGLETSLFVIGDLDSDGADDIALSKTDQLQIVYGSPTRFAGRVQVQADLTFANKGPYVTPSVGDVNGDGHPDLLFHANAIERRIEDWDVVPLDVRLHVAYGTGSRMNAAERGVASLFEPVGYTAPTVEGNGFAAMPIGDIDGDGSSDLVLGARGEKDPRDATVHLMPGSTPAPD